MATALAVCAAVAGRFCKRPALTHCLWVLVLLKLVTPPLLPVSVLPSWGEAEAAAEPAPPPPESAVVVQVLIPAPQPEPTPPVRRQLINEVGNPAAIGKQLARS